LEGVNRQKGRFILHKLLCPEGPRDTQGLSLAACWSRASEQSQVPSQHLPARLLVPLSCSIGPTAFRTYIFCSVFNVGPLAAVLTGRLTGDARSSNPVLPCLLASSGGRVLSVQSSGNREEWLLYKSCLERIAFLYTVVSSSVMIFVGIKPCKERRQQN